MLQLYFNPPKSSWSLRVWILLKTLNIPFEPKIVRYQSNLNAQRQQFQQFSPTAKIPVLVDNDHTIWDSLAITEYVAESYPQVWAEDKTARAWSRSACAEMHSGFHVLREICDFRPLDRITLADIPDELVHELARLNDLWQEGLNRFASNFLASEQFTAVDAFFLPIALRIETYSLHRYFSEKSLAYQRRLLTLPELKIWLQS
ncbi:glutathione S-transferase N-terminal domain-containing protein [Mannheimia pernigra]|uniref:Glutathione S-transferase N-terminal domain-containing protein n=1 Tax=Mannheimia pernigra TaxID=111844 RepID=A0ABD7A892_9PAST|nr:glutathione S-transferase N-terminal domain-containing protein [Mannheimia pernigra]QLB42260.1 glutathione S-transferase N-terminal domain-containing protein [Mannheimia pernigra]